MIKNMIKPQILKGFRDFLPKEARKRQYVINALKEVFELYGFEPLETPALEYEEILLGKYGEEGDKLMYRFTDRGGRKVALRYDQTVPLARVASQYSMTGATPVIALPFKRYQIQPVWRAENTQKGRFREFIQCDADIVGSSSPLSDAEVIVTATKSLEKLGFKNFKILINDRFVFNSGEFVTLAENELGPFLRSLDKIKKIGLDQVLEEMGNSKIPRQKAENVINSVKNQKPTPNLQKMMNLLNKYNVSNVQFEPLLVRGLDYYSGMIFEVEIEGYSGGSVAGGGRYDNLIGMFSGNPIPAVGFAFGFDRLIEAMDELSLFPNNTLSPAAKVLVTIFNPSLLDKSLELTLLLRRNRVATEIYLDPDVSLEKQLKYADQKGIPYAVIIGPDEVEKNLVTLRDMATRQQKQIPADKLINEFK